MRREVEAAEAAGVPETTKKTRKKSAASKDKAEKGEGKETTKKKRVAKPRTKRAKEAAQRRRLVWIVYSSTMREEGRFPFYERDKAEERLQQLLSKGKRRYFIQPIKETLNPDGTPVVQVTVTPGDEDPDEDAVKEVAAEVEPADDVDLDAEIDLDGDAEDGEAGEEGAEEESPEA